MSRLFHIKKSLSILRKDVWNVGLVKRREGKASVVSHGTRAGNGGFLTPPQLEVAICEFKLSISEVVAFLNPTFHRI